MHLQIVKIWPRFSTFSLRSFLPRRLLGNGEYVRLVEALQKHGYQQRDNLQRFQLVRTVPARDGGPDIDVVVDFLMPRDAQIAKNRPPLLSEFAVQRADGAELGFVFNNSTVLATLSCWPSGNPGPSVSG